MLRPIAAVILEVLLRIIVLEAVILVLIGWILIDLYILDLLSGVLIGVLITEGSALKLRLVKAHLRIII